MSKEVDERIVKMEFQNQGFQENAEKTIKTLDELEQSLEFKSGISKSLDVVASNFTKMGAVAHRVIQNVTDDVYNLGKNMVKSLSVDQMFAGFNEYELKMGSTQTIMASTGESLDVVNQKLKELNEYSDKTIYSFRDMTSNIGKFTNAGVKLTPAVNAMKGIANLAAVSGANAEQASHAMYNFAQSISAGYVKLVDWKSIEIANMATIEFKEQLIDTALKLGTIRQEGNKYISTTKDMNGSVSRAFDATSAFNESLSAQWLTTDVLTQTLENYASETTDIGKKANKAATEVKTFTMAIGALKESAGSGWAQTMEIIFGNYDEAVELWTNLFHRIDGWLGTMADERNKVLNAWKAFSGRDMLFEGVNNILSIFESLSKIVPNATKDLLSYNKGWRYLEDSMETIDIGPVGNAMYEGLVKATAAFRDFTKALKPSERTISNISDIMLGFITIIRDVWSIVSPTIGFTLKVLKILSPLLKIVIAVLGALGRCIYVLSELRRKLFNLGPAAKSFNEFLDGIYNNVNLWADNTVELIGNVPEALKRAMDNINSVDLPDLSDIGKSLMEGLTNAVANFKEKNTLSSFFDGFFNTESIKETGRKIKELCAGINENVRQFMEKVKMELKSSGPVGEFLVNVFETIGNAAVAVSDTTKKGVSSLGEVLGNVTEKLKEFFKGFNIAQAIKLAKVLSFIAAMLKFRKSLKSISDIAIEAKETLSALKKSIKSFAGAIKDIGKGVKLQLQAEAFKNISFGLGVIVASIIALSAIDIDKLEGAVAIFLKISAIMALLVIVVSEFSNNAKKTSEEVTKSANTISSAIGNSLNTVARGFSNSLVISALGASAAALAALLGSITIMMVAMSAIDANELKLRVEVLKDVFGMLMILVGEIGIVMASLALIDKIGSKDGEKKSKSIISSAIAIMALANAISSLMVPIVVFANMKTGKLAKGLIGVSVAVGLAVAAFAGIAILSNKSPDIAKNLKSAALALFAFSFAITSMIAPIFLLGSMDSERLNKGLWGLAHVIAYLSVLLVALGGAVRIMGKDSGSAVKMGLAFGLLAASVTVFAMMAPSIMSNVDAIENAIKFLVGAVTRSITSSANEIITCALDLVDVVLENIDKYLPKVMEHLGTVLDALLNWLEQSLPGYMSQLAKIIGNSLDAFSTSAKEYINLQDLLVMGGIIVAVIVLVRQISNMSEKIKEATPSMLILSSILVVLGLVINEIVKNSKDSATAISASISLILCIRTMTYLAKELPALSAQMKKVKILSVIKMVGSFALMALGIIGVFNIMAKENLKPTDIVEYGAGLGAAMIGISKLIQSIGASQKSIKKFKLKDIGSMAVVLLEIGIICQIVVATFKKIAQAGISGEAMLAYSAGLSLAILSLTLLIRAISVASRESRRQPDAKYIVGACASLTLVVLAVGAMFTVLSSMDVDPIQMLQYSAVLSLVFLSLVPLMKSIGTAQRAGSKMTMWRQFLGQTIEIGAIMVGVLGMFLAVHGLGMDPIKMVGYAMGMSLVFLAMNPMLKAMGNMAEGAKDTKPKRLLALSVDLIAITGSLLAVFALLDYWEVDPKNMVVRAIGLGIAFAALNPMLQGLGKAAEGAKDTKPKRLLAILADVAGITAALGLVFWGLDKLDVDPARMADYSVGLSIAFVGLSPLMAAIGLASKWGGSNVKANAILSMAVVLSAVGLIVGGVLSLMAEIDADPSAISEFAKSLSLTILAMTPLVAVIGLLQALFGKINGDAEKMLMSGLTVVAIVAAVILLASGIIGLFGALNFNGALEESLGKGVDVLVQIANGLGSFVGALVGSGIGAGLGSFAESAQPFFDMVSGLPDDFSDKMGALASGLLTLSGAALIEQIGNLFNLFSSNKDGSLEKLGEDLNEFAPEMVELSESLEEITPERAQVMKSAGEGLKAIIDAIPKTDGLFQDIFGEVDVSGFGDNLTDLGEGIVDFADSVKNIKESDVKHGVTCAELVASLNEKLPLTGGALQWVTGFPDIGKFADNLPELGEGLADFNDAITEDGKSILNQSAIEAATAALNGLAGVTHNVADNSGFWTALSGFPDMSKFAKHVGELGVGLKKFSKSVKDIDKTKAEDSVEILNSIAQISMYLETSTIDTDQGEKFSEGAESVTAGFKSFAKVLKNLKEVDGIPFSSLTNLLNTIIGIKGKLSDAVIDSEIAASFASGSDALTDGLRDVAGILKDLDSIEEGLDSTSLIKKVDQIKQTIKNKLYVNPGNPNNSSWKAGKNITLGVSNGILDVYAVSALRESCETMVDYAFAQIQTTADEHSPSKRAEKDGENLTKGYAEGIKKNANLVKKPSEFVVEEAFNSMRDALNKAYKLMNENEGFTPVIAPVVDLSNARRSASELNNLFSATKTDFGSETIPTKAIKMSRAVKIETDAQRSTTDLTKVTESILRIGNKLSDMESKLEKVQVVLDSGELVGGMTSKLAKSLQKQQANRSRGVISSIVR